MATSYQEWKEKTNVRKRKRLKDVTLSFKRFLSWIVAFNNAGKCFPITALCTVSQRFQGIFFLPEHGNFREFVRGAADVLEQLNDTMKQMDCKTEGLH